MNIFKKRETRNLGSTGTGNVVHMNAFTRGVQQSYAPFNAIENSDIFSGINRIASDIASLDVEKSVHGVTQTDNNLSYLFNVRPNDFYNGYQLKFIIIANILLNGEAFVELERNPRNKIENLYHIKNSQIQPKQDESTGFELVYEVFEDQRKRIIHSKDIFHFKFFSLDGISGVSPLKALKSDMDTQESSKRFLNNFFRQGQGSSGILKYKGGKLNKDARDKLKDDWQEANSGVDESHKVVVLDESMDYEPLPIDVNSEILKLVNASNFTSEQVAKVLKI